MFHKFSDYFSNSNFMPHGYGYLWQPEILWLHLGSDLIIALSYFSIPIMMHYFIYKKKSVPHSRLFKLFAAFIFLCGLTHLISIWTIWDPIYQIEGLAKGLTAIISAVTAMCLFSAIPKVLALKSPEELEKINKRLELALAEKNSIENKLLKANESLENEVEKRTQEILKYTSKLQVVNTELESFVHQASHDLKSPLNNVLGLLKELNESPDCVEKYQKFLPRIESNLKRLNDFITDILDLSKMGEEEVKKEWVDLSEIIEEAKANVFHMIEDSGAGIYIDNTFDIFCNKNQLILVFQNLLENAIKYTAQDREPEIIISSQKKGDVFCCEVKDNGIGISKDHLDDIFKPFLRLHSDEDYPGTGLGLSICKKIISNHGGTIRATSQIDEGSIFSFSMPRTGKD